jgi:hypothetical protein
LAVHFDVHRSSDIQGFEQSGLGVDRALRARARVNGARTRLDGPAPPASSFIPAITVERLRPDASVTRACPPAPSIVAVAPSNSRRLAFVQQWRHHRKESRERLLGDLHTGTLLRGSNQTGDP